MINKDSNFWTKRVLGVSLKDCQAWKAHVTSGWQFSNPHHETNDNTTILFYDTKGQQASTALGFHMAIPPQGVCNKFIKVNGRFKT